MAKRKKKTPYRMELMLHGRVVWLDDIYTKESALLRRLFEGEYQGVKFFRIQSSDLQKALDFCKRRAEVRIQHMDDNLLTQHKLKDFDSDFLQQIRTTDDDDYAIIRLIDAACKIEIDSLLDLLLDDVVEMMTRKTPEEIEKIFIVRYNGNDRLFDSMKNLLGIARWVLK